MASLTGDATGTGGGFVEDAFGSSGGSSGSDATGDNDSGATGGAQSQVDAFGADRSEARDGQPGEVFVQGPKTYTNYCARVHWTATAAPAGTSDSAVNAIDGRPSTRWSTERPQQGGEYLQIDFGGAVRFNQVVLDNRSGTAGDYPRGYRISVSNDGMAFTSAVGPVAVGQGPGPVLTIALPWAEGRYARIGQTGSDGAWWGVNEIRFNCQLVTAPPPDAVDPYDPASWKATASANVGGAGPSNAFDSDLASRWTTGAQQRGTESFVLDLGAVTSVGLVILESPPAEAPVRYSLHLSSDNVAFTPAAAGSGTPITQIQFTARSARYVRITQTGTGADWWSISEITVKP